MELDECYSYRSLARLLNKDRRWVQRRLTEGKVFPRPGGKIWISDIDKKMPHFLESFATKLHHMELATMRGDEDPEKPEGDDY